MQRMAAVPESAIHAPRGAGAEKVLSARWVLRKRLLFQRVQGGGKRPLAVGPSYANRGYGPPESTAHKGLF